MTMTASLSFSYTPQIVSGARYDGNLEGTEHCTDNIGNDTRQQQVLLMLMRALLFRLSAISYGHARHIYSYHDWAFVR